MAAAAPADVAQDWGVGNPGGPGNGRGSGTLGSGSFSASAGFGNGGSARGNAVPGQSPSQESPSNSLFLDCEKCAQRRPRTLVSSRHCLVSASK